LIELGSIIENKWKVVLVNEQPNNLTFMKGLPTPPPLKYVNLAICSLVDTGIS
jgi:hypothetical protein